MAQTDANFYFIDRQRNRQGPFTEADITRLIGDATIQAETLIWHTGLQDWIEAGSDPAFAALFTQPRTPSPGAGERTAGATITEAVPPLGALTSTLPVWGLFWRCLLLAAGFVLILPAPWVGAQFYRYIAQHTVLPGGRRLTFAGAAGDIWPVFVGIGVLIWVQQLPYLKLVALPCTWALSVLAFRWFCAKLGSADGSVRLAFAGDIWSYIGWNLLFIVSIVTIVGWAWVLRAIMRWMCRNVTGTVRFDFVGTGPEILWRSVVMALLSMLLVPLPWMVRWFTVWFISQVRVVEASA